MGGDVDTPVRRPAVAHLVDRYGRRATNLRVSLTDRCNLRCTYCMPDGGLPWLARPSLLTDGEVVRLIAIAVRSLGVSEVRFTGGEPLLRPGLVDIVAGVAALTPRPVLSLTTNGIGLAGCAGVLAAAGLDRVNVSVDTLKADRFETLTRRPRLAEVLDGIRAAEAVGLRPIKLNAVLMRSVNDDEAVGLLSFALSHGYQLRFIEQMPLDAQHAWRRDDMVTAGEILGQLRSVFTLRPDPAERGAAPAQTWLVDGHTEADGRTSTVGVIASVTQPFCGSCERTRLTADGQVRNCLFSREETDLRTLLRGGAPDDVIAAAWRSAMWGKRPGHGIDDPSFLRPARPMSAIGG